MSNMLLLDRIAYQVFTFMRKVEVWQFDFGLRYGLSPNYKLHYQMLTMIDDTLEEIRSLYTEDIVVH